MILGPGMDASALVERIKELGLEKGNIGVTSGSTTDFTHGFRLHSLQPRSSMNHISLPM